MKNMKKGILFFGAAVVVLAMVSSTIALGETLTTQPKKSEPLLFASIHVTVWLRTPWGPERVKGEVIACKDLNTGVIKYATSNYFGNCDFWLLTKHHDYQISDTQPPYHSLTVHDLNGWVHVDLWLTEGPPC